MKRLAGRIILLWGWRRALAALAAGALAALGQAPWDFFAACFISFPVLVWLLDGAEGDGSRRLPFRLAPAFAVGWWFGFGYFMAGLWWVGNALLVEADEFAWALPVAVLGLPALLALFYGFATALARSLWSDDFGRIAALAVSFAVAEWLRSFLLTGFPWNPVGLAAMPVPLLMQSVAVVGPHAMNALAVLVFSLPALAASDRHVRTGLALGVLLLAAHAGYGYARLSMVPAPDRTLAVRIIQPSVDQAEKWDATVRDRIFANNLELSGAPSETGMPKLIVWPETSVPFIFTERPDALVAIGELLQPGQRLFVGAVRSEGGSGPDAARYYNSVVSINDQGEIDDAVDKMHLVPFGEYLPFEGMFARLGISKLVALPGSFSPGSTRHALLAADGVAAAPFICYEIIFPALVGDGAQDADMLVNVTNDAWFGDTPGPYQHFRQAQLRAVETGLPLVRAANNGISAVVDAHGRIVDALAVNAVGVLDVEVPLGRGVDMRVGRTAVNGVLILILLGVAAVAMSLRSRAGSN